MGSYAEKYSEMEREVQFLRKELERARKNEATHKISAVYYPKTGQTELTFEDLDTMEVAAFTVHLSKSVGEKLAEVVPPCVYSKAKLR